MKLELEEVRRLTGPNLLSPYAGALVDANISGIEHEAVWLCWQKHISTICLLLNWPTQNIYRRNYDGGISLSVSAPLDCLYTACDAAELAWHQTAFELCPEQYSQRVMDEHNQEIEVESRITQLPEQLQQEVNPNLMTLINTAIARGVSWLTDDDEFSLGTGKTCQVWPISQLPNLVDINWQQYKKIPAAFITGTNGKSTSVRLASAIAQQDGLNAGVTSTDFIRVGDKILDTGDYSGPGGARMLLRHVDTEIAFLEVARGGLLRRGLPVSDNQAALITNIAADHLGQYGINTLQELGLAKFIVDMGITDDATIVLNADDLELVKLSEKTKHLVCWFSMNKLNDKIVHNLKYDLPVVYFDNGFVHYCSGNADFSVAVTDIGMTFNGTAVYNIRNAMGVIGLVKSMGISEKAIVAGLKIFGSSVEDNPGRGNHYKYKGAQVIVDFAHNQHSMNAVIAMAKQLPAKRRIVMCSHAGDRSDQDITNLTDELIQFSPDKYIIAELPLYLRGREFGEISQLSEKYLLKSGVTTEQIIFADSPLLGAQKALSNVEEGDVILLFTLDERDKVDQLLQVF